MQRRKRQFNFSSVADTVSTPLLPIGKQRMPTVYYTREVLEAIDYIVDRMSSEVGWFGLVEALEDGDYLITEIFIPAQTVSGATVDMKSNAVAQLAERLLRENKDPSKLRYHGHSHVNMGVGPSSVDQDMVDDFLEHSDWFIRGIYNKKGDSRVDVFDREARLVHQNVLTDELRPALLDSFYIELNTQLKNNVQEAYQPRFLPQGVGTLGDRAGLFTAADDPWLKRQAALNNKFVEDDAELAELLQDPFYVGGY